MTDQFYEIWYEPNVAGSHF